MKKNIAGVIFLSLFLSLLLSGISWAETEKTVPDYHSEMDTIVVTAGRVEEQKKEIAANITILDDQEIKISSARDLGELLAEKGIGSIKKYPGNLTTLGIRGFRTDSHGNDLKGHVLILLNGRRAGTGNVAKILTKNIERIEIIRGPASVQYGSAAMGGVVNVITKQGKEKPSVFAQGYLGSFNHEEISAGGSGKTGKFDFSGSATREKQGDYTTGNGIKYQNTGFDSRESLSLNLGYEFLPENRVGLLFNGFEVDKAGSPSYLSQNDLDDYTDKSNQSFDLVLEGETQDKIFSWKARYFQGKDQDTWMDPTASNPDGWDDGIASESTTDSKGAQAQVSADFGLHLVTIGFDWVEYDVTATWSPEETSYDNPAGFLMGKTRLLDERLILSAGVRYDQYEVDVLEPAGKKADDSNLTPNVGLAYLLTDMIKVRAGYSQAFVMPGADQMAADYTIWGIQYAGNPELTPEKSKTYEAGIDLFYRSLSGSITGFYTDFTDKIESITLPSGDSSWENVGKARVSGFEGDLSFDLGDYFNWDYEVKPYAGFTYLTDFEDRETGKDLLETSDLTASYGISVSDFQGFSARLNFSYIGEKTVTDYESGFPSDVKLKSSTVASLTVRKQLFESQKASQLSLMGEINNLFDKQYEYNKGYPMPGRSFYVGLNYRY
jgi:vitamin B12 transporter